MPEVAKRKDEALKQMENSDLQDARTTRVEKLPERPGLKDVADEVRRDSQTQTQQYLDEVVVPDGGE